MAAGTAQTVTFMLAAKGLLVVQVVAGTFYRQAPEEPITLRGRVMLAATDKAAQTMAVAVAVEQVGLAKTDRQTTAATVALPLQTPSLVARSRMPVAEALIFMVLSARHRELPVVVVEPATT